MIEKATLPNPFAASDGGSYNAFHVADQIAYLHDGRIYFHGTPEELRQSSDQLLQDFLLGRSDEQLTPKAFGVES